jgi:hypothetical protein
MPELAKVGKPEICVGEESDGIEAGEHQRLHLQENGKHERFLVGVSSTQETDDGRRLKSAHAGRQNGNKAASQGQDEYDRRLQES